jgi:hypothetical protein
MRHPIHVVCEWPGKLKLIAQEHYLRVIQEDLDRATSAENSLERKESGAQGGAQSGENGTQWGPKPGRRSAKLLGKFAVSGGIE